MAEPTEQPRPIDTPHDPGAEPRRGAEPEELGLDPDPVDPLKRADEEPGKEDLPGADPTPPPVPPG